MRIGVTEYMYMCIMYEVGDTLYGIRCTGYVVREYNRVMYGEWGWGGGGVRVV